MIPSSPQKTPTVIIAHRGQGNHLKNVFQDLKLWFDNIVVVGPASPYFSQIVKDNGGSWVSSDSLHIGELWDKGMKTQQSDWYMLVQDIEYLSSVLKESVIENVSINKVKKRFYIFERKSFFLKKRLK